MYIDSVYNIKHLLSDHQCLCSRGKNELICHLILNIFLNGQIPQMTRRTYE